MRILFLTDKFIPERGGSQIILAKAYEQLRGHDITVVTRAWEGAAEVDASYPHRVIRVPYSRIPRLRSPLLWFSIAKEANRLIEETRFDQVHCGQTVETAPIGAGLAMRYGIPLVVHTFAEDVTTYLNHPLYLKMMMKGLRAASAVTSISRYTVRHLQTLGVPDERIRLLYPGVTASDWAPTGREKVIRDSYGLHGRKVILTLARLIPRKGQDTTLRALPRVLQQVPDLVYLVVGGGPEESRLKSLARELGVADHVRWVGSIPNSEAVDYYHASDLFVMPNRRMPNGDIEGFGLVFLEANACGLPVIGGNSGGAPDAIEHDVTGKLVDPESPEQLAAFLIEMLTDDDKRRRMGAAGRARVAERFTWERTGETLSEVVDLAASAPASIHVPTRA